MRRPELFVILLLALLPPIMMKDGPLPVISPLAAPFSGTDYPWTMFHYDGLRLGVSPASAPTSAALAWSFTTGAQVYASPAVVDGIVFIPSWDGSLYAINEYTGQTKWAFKTGASIYASVAVSNGVVYLASRDSGLYAINEQSGMELWRVSNISPLTSSPVVADGKVFYGTWYVRFWSQLMAVNVSNGTTAWQYLGDDTIISSPSVHNGRVFFGQNNGYIVALNETTGAQLWKVAPLGTVQITASPAVAYGKVYVGTNSGFLALDELTGATVWSFNTGGTSATTGAVNNGVVYFGTGNGYVRAVNSTTGSSIWRYTVGTNVTSSPALALGTGTLIFGATNNYLYALTLSGILAWRYLTGASVSSSPAVANGHVFFGGEDFKIYSLGPQTTRLSVTVSPSVTQLKPGDSSLLTVSVSNGTSPMSGATLTFTSSLGGGFSQPASVSPGTYVSNYTAPVVGSVTATTITVTVSLTGYYDGVAQTTITLNPLPSLGVSVTPKPSTVTPGGELVLMIKVTNGSMPLPGATLYLTASAGSFGSLSDDGSGNYTAIYSSPLQSSTTTLTVQASKPGFVTGQAQTTVTVAGVPDLTSVKVAGFPIFFVVAGIFVLFFMISVAAIAKRRADRSNDFRF